MPKGGTFRDMPKGAILWGHSQNNATEIANFDDIDDAPVTLTLGNGQ